MSRFRKSLVSSAIRSILEDVAANSAIAPDAGTATTARSVDACFGLGDDVVIARRHELFFAGVPVVEAAPSPPPFSPFSVSTDDLGFLNSLSPSPRPFALFAAFRRRPFAFAFRRTFTADCVDSEPAFDVCALLLPESSSSFTSIAGPLDSTSDSFGLLVVSSTVAPLLMMIVFFSFALDLALSLTLSQLFPFAADPSLAGVADAVDVAAATTRAVEVSAATTSASALTPDVRGTFLFFFSIGVIAFVVSVAFDVVLASPASLLASALTSSSSFFFVRADFASATFVSSSSSSSSSFSASPFRDVLSSSSSELTRSFTSKSSSLSKPSRF